MSFHDTIETFSWFLLLALTQSAPGAALTATSPNESEPRHAYTNRLIREKSPYLLQHAHNPVDWYPWGEEAFLRARTEQKPIFLSVGYSTCHWCHVMERESFENPEIAKALNTGFVCIKVDREERPDIDQIYMAFVQATTGSGGWPMTVWLTPGLKPFLGGTYFPPEKLSGVLARVTEAWRIERDQVTAASDSITRKLQQSEEPNREKSPALSSPIFDDCYGQLHSGYEPRYGGFGTAPKFPRPASLALLHRYYARTGKQDALDMSLHTLRKMAEGGIHDHLGGGFHRYSTDVRWHVPHFEKMLYDQAQLVCVYLEAFQITHDNFFADIARDILQYVQRDLTGPEGQLYSAEDADSPLPGTAGPSAEGAFYVWTKNEIDGALGATSGALFDCYYGVEAEGNVESDPRGELKGKNVLMVNRSLKETAQQFKISPEEASRILEEARHGLFKARIQRPRPRLDDKAITAWNGLMISAFARAAQVLEDPSFTVAARGVRSFLHEKCYNPVTKGLFRRFRAGDAAIGAYAADYSFLIQGLLDLYETTFEPRDLEWAIALQTTQLKLFEDTEHGGFFTTAGGDTNVLMRMKEDYDGAEPAANSVAALNLLRLAQITDNQTWRKSGEGTLLAVAEHVREQPASMPQMLVALDFSLGKAKQIVLAGTQDATETQAMLEAIHGVFLPNKVVLLADGAEGQRFLGQYLEFLRGLKPLSGKTTAFVCENYVCQAPTTNLATLRTQLAPAESVKPLKALKP